MTMTTETKVTTQVYRVYIKATAQAIWDAITRSEWTERYGYRTPVEYDLRPGGAYLAPTNEGMRSQGAGDVAVDGEVIEVDPPHRLVQSWRMVMDPETAAEGFTNLTWEIEEGKGGVSRLTVTHDLEGASRLALLVSGTFEDEGGGAGGGWAWVLSDLKTLLETGKPLA